MPSAFSVSPSPRPLRVRYTLEGIYPSPLPFPTSFFHASPYYYRVIPPLAVVYSKQNKKKKGEHGRGTSRYGYAYNGDSWDASRAESSSERHTIMRLCMWNYSSYSSRVCKSVSTFLLAHLHVDETDETDRIYHAYACHSRSYQRWSSVWT